jgi:hypothetical protein
MQDRIHRKQARWTGHRSEPPPASRRPGSRHPLRREAAPQPIDIDHNELFQLPAQGGFPRLRAQHQPRRQEGNVPAARRAAHPSAAGSCTSTSSASMPRRRSTMKVPLHFVNADIAPGVKLAAAWSQHTMNELDVQCLPADLPEFIEVDLKDWSVGHSVHVSHLKLPKGVESVCIRAKATRWWRPSSCRAACRRSRSAKAQAAAAPAARPPSRSRSQTPTRDKPPQRPAFRA